MCQHIPDHHQICKQKWGILLLADFLTVTKCATRKGGCTSAGTDPDCHQKCQQKRRGNEVFLPADLLIATKIGDGFSVCHQICQQKREGICTSRFPDHHQICKQKCGVLLLADFLTVTKSFTRNGGCTSAGISASRLFDCHYTW